MPYLGTPPQSGFITSDAEKITGQTTNYVNLSNAISSLDDVQVHVNYVIQDPSTLTLNSTTQIGLGDTLVSSDVVLVTYLGKAVATQSPPVGGVTNDMLAGNIANSKLATPTTINNNADNRVITGSGTANTLEGESNLTYDGTTFQLSQASPIFKILPTTNGNDGVIELCGRSTDGSPTENRTQIKGEAEGSTANTKMTFHVENSGGVNERASISSDGIFKVNNRIVVDADVNSSSKINAEFGGNSENGQYFNDKDGASHARYIGFERGGTLIGQIKRDGTNDNISYVTSSDYRLKDGVVNKTDGIEKIKLLKPRKFYWKSNPDKTLVDGFLAHEVSDIVPEAISGTKDDVDENDKIIPQGIDQSKLVPLLTSALQEAITKIETLEARVQELENA